VIPPPEIDALLAELRDAPPARANRLVAELHRRIERRAVGLLGGWLRSAGLAAEADDLYQDFSNALLLGAARGFRGDRPGAGWRWVRVVLLNRARDLLRQKRTEPLEPHDEPADVAPGSDDSEPAEWLREKSRVVWIGWVKAALRSVRRDYRRDLRRNLAILRDFHFREEDVGTLAVRYFASDTPANRNKVSQYKARASEKLREVWQELERP
jgi:DNA-directed RNA polymerase specialized sigma24 family protein